MGKHFFQAPEKSGRKILDSVFADMVLNKALRDFRKEQIQKGIDHALKLIFLTFRKKDLNINIFKRIFDSPLGSNIIHDIHDINRQI